MNPSGNPYSSVRYGKNYTAHKITYPTLSASRVTAAEKEAIRAEIKPITSGEEAERFVFTKVDDQPRYTLGWRMFWLDQLHRAGVLCKNGVEVALFFKRQIVEEEPAPGDPVPEGWLKEPLDAWQRLDLFGKSAREANLFLKKKHEHLNQEVTVLQQRVEASRVLADTSEDAKFRAEDALAAREKTILQLQERISVIQQHVSGVKIRKWLETNRRLKDKEAKRKARVDARKKKVLKELQAKELKKIDRAKQQDLKKKAAEKAAKKKAKKKK